MKEYMEQVSVKEAINAGRETLCWDCQKAVRGGCCWSDPAQQKPVDGWVAEETEMGYRVAACPEFSRGTYGAGRYRTADDYILALEILATDQAKQIDALKKTIWWKNVKKLSAEKRQIVLKHKLYAEKAEQKLMSEKRDHMKDLWAVVVHMSE